MEDRIDELKKENLVDLMALGRSEGDFTVYGLKGKHIVKIGLLDDGEMDEVYRRTKNLDILTRQRLMEKEILIISILVIDGEEFFTPEKKIVLRKILDNCSPLQTSYIYSLYIKLEQLQRISIERTRSELEKSLSDIPEKVEEKNKDVDSASK